MILWPSMRGRRVSYCTVTNTAILRYLTHFIRSHYSAIIATQIINNWNVWKAVFVGLIQCVYRWMVQFQKLKRNLFLTLHGHNVHRQQGQLSKFLMRYQQFAFHAYCGATGSVSKMAPQQEKAFCVLRFEVSRSVITVQREFRAQFRKDAPCMVRLF